MNTSATLQHAIQIRPSRLAGLVFAVATLTAVTTWSVTNATNESHTASPKAVSTSYVDAVTELTPEQQAAVWGNVPTAEQHASAISALNPDQQAAIYGNVSPAQQYVDGIGAMTPVELAAAFGNVSSTP